MERIINMKRIIKQLVESTKQDIINDIDIEEDEACETLFKLVIAAYNRYQEDERDGAAYIFDINNNNDLSFLVGNNLFDAAAISSVYNDYKANRATSMFMLGEENTAEAFVSIEAVKSLIVANLDKILLRMFAYHTTDGYRELYDYCFGEPIADIFKL